MTITPKIYVACLASYNSGILHGEWIDLDESENINDSIASILKESPIADAEEWAVHGYEFCGNLSEYAGIAELKSLKDAFTLATEEEIEWDLFCDFCSQIGHKIEDSSVDKYKDSYAGSANSLVDWCHNFMDDTGGLESIPENLRFYFNMEAYARDLEINDVFTVEHQSNTHIFWNTSQK